MVGHGYLPMLISKRHLLSAYFTEKNQSLAANQDFAYQISEETRPGTLFPILEDEFGTHLFRPAALASFEEIAALREWFVDFYIETIFLPEDEVLLAIEVYAGLATIQQFYARSMTPYDHGFYDRPTAAKKEASQ